MTNRAGSDADRLRLLVVGAGRMGRVHLEAIAHAPSVVPVAVVEPHEPTREGLAGSGPDLYPSLEAALAAGGFDAALVATPSGLHREVAAALLTERVPTLCEKPCGLRSSETREVARLAAETGTPLQVGYWRRFVPELRTLRDEICHGTLGEIALAQAWQWDGEPPAAQFRRTSGGPLLDMGVHEFDMVRWLSGMEISLDFVVDSEVNSVEPVNHDPESLLAAGRLSGGGVVAVSLGRRYDRGDCCWVEVIGTLGSRRCEFMTGPSGDAVFRQALIDQIDAFAGMVRGEPSTAASVEDAIATLQIVETGTAMYTSQAANESANEIANEIME
jgi:myo-inositol 2-dehydrogenase/D-chiro-inositol 1-dehydrogenase